MDGNVDSFGGINRRTGRQIVEVDSTKTPQNFRMDEFDGNST